MGQKILVVEDELSIQNILKESLSSVGFGIDTASDGVEGLIQFKKNKYDLIILDIMMPKMNGHDVCKVIRMESNIPIIILTALDDEENQVMSFDNLADDYILKPFSINVLIKRIKAILRRTEIQANEEAVKGVLKYRRLMLDLDGYSAYMDSQKVLLTNKEFELLKLLIENKGIALTRDQILNNVWNYDFYGDEKLINTHVRNIRRKLGDDYIITVRGVGYKVDK